MLRTILCLLTLNIFINTGFSSSSSNISKDSDDMCAESSSSQTKAYDDYYVIKEPEEFKKMALHGDINNSSIQQHNYNITLVQFRAIEKKVIGTRTANGQAMLTVALAHRYGIPSIGIDKNVTAACRLFKKILDEKKQNTSVYYHIVALIADNEVNKDYEWMETPLRLAYMAAQAGSAPFLTLMLKIDRQKQNAILSEYEYRTALKRIIDSAYPNARAYIELAKLTRGFAQETIRDYYLNALQLEPDNFEANYNLGILLNNASQNNVSFTQQTNFSAQECFENTYALDKHRAGNYYGRALYLNAATSAQFEIALRILEQSTLYDPNAYLSIADYYAYHHAEKPADFEKSFHAIISYMQVQRINSQNINQVINVVIQSMKSLANASAQMNVEK